MADSESKQHGGGIREVLAFIVSIGWIIVSVTLIYYATRLASWWAQPTTVPLDYTPKTESTIKATIEHQESITKKLNGHALAFTRYTNEISENLAIFKNPDDYLKSPAIQEQWIKDKQDIMPHAEKHRLQYRRASRDASRLEQKFKGLEPFFRDYRRKADETEAEFRLRTQRLDAEMKRRFKDIRDFAKNHTDHLQEINEIGSYICYKMKEKRENYYMLTIEEASKPNDYTYYIGEYGKTVIMCGMAGIGLATGGATLIPAIPYIVPSVLGASMVFGATKVIFDEREEAAKRRLIVEEATNLVRKYQNSENVLNAAALYNENIIKTLDRGIEKMDQSHYALFNQNDPTGHYKSIQNIESTLKEIEDEYQSSLHDQKYIDFTNPQITAINP